jgi:hypothetical protein
MAREPPILLQDTGIYDLKWRRAGIVTMGSQHCTVCASPDRHRLDLARARGISLRVLGRKYGLSRDSVARHWRNHVPAALKADLKKRALIRSEADLTEIRNEEATGLLENLRALRGRLFQTLDIAERYADLHAVARLHAEIRANLETVGKLVGELNSHAVKVENNLVVSGDYLRLRSILIAALKPYPEARRAVAAALAAIEAPTPTEPKQIEIQAQPDIAEPSEPADRLPPQNDSGPAVSARLVEPIAEPATARPSCESEGGALAAPAPVSAPESANVRIARA